VYIALLAFETRKNSSGMISELVGERQGEYQSSWYSKRLTIENLFKERQELSRKLLNEERAKGALESRNIALATLSHYLNNAVMAI
jgi:hypothetical protein